MTPKYYFTSDIHLGLTRGDAKARERRFVRWLDDVKRDASAIYLLGDVFDFWCEYKKVVPRGFVRTLGKLAEITDKGIPVHFFAGNHDMWFTDYLSSEVGLILHRTPFVTELAGKNFYLSHGDEIIMSNRRLKFRRKLFTNRILQKLLRTIHPRWVLAFAHRWSRNNRLSKGIAMPFRGDDEALVQFAKKYAALHSIDYFVFGHLHTSTQLNINNTSQCTVLGEWIEGGEYAVFDGEKMVLGMAEP